MVTVEGCEQYGTVWKRFAYEFKDVLIHRTDGFAMLFGIRNLVLVRTSKEGLDVYLEEWKL